MNIVLSRAHEVWPQISGNTRIITQGATRIVGYPATRWDAFKRDFFPRFMIKLFPIRWVSKTHCPRKVTMPIMRKGLFNQPFGKIEIELQIQNNGLDAGYNSEYDVLYVSIKSMGVE